MVGSNSWIYLFVSVCVTLPSRCASYSNLPDTAQVQLSLTTLSDAEKCRLPNDVTASVTLASDVIDLHLHKNEHVSSQAQVFVIKETGHGRTVVQPYSSPLDEGYKLYQDKNRTASIMLRCPTKGGTSYIVEGTFVYGGDTLRLTHSSRKRRDVSSAKAHAEEYNVVVEKEPGAATADFKEPPTEVLPKKATFQDFQGLPFALAPPVRRRRQTSPYYVDVVAVIDYAVYLDWYRRSTQTVEEYRQSETLSNIRRYFALIMNGVDLRYQGIHALPYRINIRLIGYIVAQTASVATWTERFRVVSSPRYAVNADSALTAFSDWAASSDSLPSHDHAVLFTGYDLFTIAGGTMKTATTGLAYIGTLCSLTGKSVSVVEETGAFGSVETTAHEIGHSLSAKHDGDGNTCSSNDRYIMAAGGPDLDTANKVNSWIFSSCSVDYFKNFINNMMRTSRGVTCLTTPLPVLSVPDVSAVLPGQLYDPDAQCRQLHGSQSRLCRGPEFGTAASVCTSMYCYDPSTSKTCYEHVAARGTSCGDKKWCIDGQCVYSTDAPSKDDSCVFGDQEGVAFDNKDCGSFVADYPGYCYQSVVRGRCCATCKRHYIPLSNCEYGDKVAGCKTNGCGYRYQDGSIYDENCCGTCNYGTVVSTTPKPAISLTTTPTTTVTTQSGITQSPGVCKDLQGVLFDGRTCSQYLQNNLAACYNDNVRVVCCGTCEARSTKLNGCEYGDRQPSECSRLLATKTTCPTTLQTACCATCRTLENEVNAQAAVTSQRAMWIVVFLGLLSGFLS